MNNNNRWFAFDKTRKARYHKSGFLVIKPKHVITVPFECPVCSLIMRNSKDVLSYQEYKSCFACATYLIIPNIKQWKNGWKPTKQQIKEYIKNIRNNY
tara:strand:+ start:2001 stop:2294 length:294 start_codon:yes stop_codon:yes gene_type:complete